MAEVKAFKALRYTDTKNMKNLVTPPYDIISPDAQKNYYDRDKNNVIRLEYGIINESDSENDNRYTRAKEFLDKSLENGVLKTDPENAYYIYEEIFEALGQKMSLKGIFAAVKLEEFDKKIILPHEETLPKAKKDRLLLMEHTDCNFSPIYLMYSDEKREIPEVIDKHSQCEPAVSFVNDDGIEQRLWLITDETDIKIIENAFSKKQLFIADGHHRYETALNFRNEKRAENPNFTGDEGYNYVMSFLIDMENTGLVVLPTHRMIKGIADFSPKKITDALKENFTVEKLPCEKSEDIENGIKTENEKIFGFYTGGDFYYRITLKSEENAEKEMKGASKYYRALDVAVLHSMILEKLFGIDKENMANQKNLTYTRSADEAVKSVKNGEYQCAFIINATKISQIKDISLNNEKMPQKSTYFYPKLVTGIVMNKLK